MQILIILLVLLLLSVLLPILLPILAVGAILVLILNLRRMFSPDNFKKFDQGARKNIFDNQADRTPQEDTFRQETDNAPVYERPTSVRDDAFWEQNHTVLDVPFEEAPPADPDDGSQDR